MKLLRKRAKYASVLPKEKAATELRKDRRIKKVVSTKDGLTIYTKPIIPICDCDITLDYPIGEYIIDVLWDSYFETEIQRIGEALSDYKKSIHVFRSGNICWGNAEYQIETIIENKDWFWFVKRVLDVLEDGEDEDIGEFQVTFTLQIDYARQKGQKKIISLLQESYDEWYMKFEEEYGYFPGD